MCSLIRTVSLGGRAYLADSKEFHGAPCEQSRTLALLLVGLMAICSPCQRGEAKYAGGSGTREDPYQIWTAEQMNAIGADPNDWDKHFKLMVDIDLGGYTGTAFNIIGTNWINPFSGVFDGQGHTISNFSYASAETDFTGLFGCIDGEDAEITDLGLVVPNVNAGTGNRVGSLVGELDEGTITGCHVEGGSVSGYTWVGGLVGFSSHGMITNSYATCRVSGNRHVGGLIGPNSGTISDSYATGEVSADKYAGGLAAGNGGTISNCYASGNVSGSECLGGLVGDNGGRVSNCYSIGQVTGEDYVGGLVGFNGGVVLSCFWDMQASGVLTSAGGVGKTTAEMKLAETFVGWGCDPVWTIREGVDYPRLTWEDKLGRIIFKRLSDYLPGRGEPDDPYLIYTAEQLNMIGSVPCDWDKHFKLMADIDLSEFVGAAFNIIGYEVGVGRHDYEFFSGVFDGNGHTISNFSYTGAGRDNVGLFGYVIGEHELITNLGLIDPNVDAGTGRNAGALVGELPRGSISNCYVQGGSIAGDDSVGGLVGHSTGTIANCYCSASVSGTGYEVGGLVGDNRGAILNCYAVASVSGTRYDVGGLGGANNGLISNCYASGNVSGSERLGGLVGTNNGVVSYCYSTCEVMGDGYAGGLVGFSDRGQVLSSFWDIEASGVPTSAGGEGKITAELQTADTFVGWGCELAWTVDEGIDYPRLIWENAPGRILSERLSDYLMGSGEPNDPYLVYTAEQLNMIGLFWCDWDKHFRLMDDIDLSEFTGADFNIIGYYRDVCDERLFTGVFDGNGKEISNFSYTSTGRHFIGLFAYVSGENAQIKDLGLIDPNVDAGTGGVVGSLVGTLRDGTVTNCYVQNGFVSGGEEIGGLVGWSYGTTSNCFASANVSGTRYVGGLVGRNSGTITESSGIGIVSGDLGVASLVGRNGGTISDCYSSGTISGKDAIGGLVGSHWGEALGCYSSASVSGNSRVGGLVAYNSGIIENCYATGSVDGNDYVGGLLGYNASGIVASSYSICGVTGTTDVAGLVGLNYSGWIFNSFWDTETSGQGNSAAGEGKTTAEMQRADTFIGWGCEPVWTLNEGADYPRLWWENAPGDTITTASPLEYLEGSGKQGDPYLIRTPEQFTMVGAFPCGWNKHFKLMADIDLGTFGTDEFNVIGVAERYAFSGVFDGNHKEISNFNLTSTRADYIGLFGYIRGGEIRDLGLTEPNVAAQIARKVGSLVGCIMDGTLRGCYAKDCNVSANERHARVGGLVGENIGGIITDCYSNGSVSAGGERAQAGGLLGRNEGTIANCHSTSGISALEPDSSAGGLAGSNTLTITNCWAISHVLGDEDVGGLIGTNGGEVRNSYSSSTVEGRIMVGGLVGGAGHDSHVIACYSLGPVTAAGNWAGGLVGMNSGTISQCYSIGSVKGLDYTGGLVGARYSSLIAASFWDVHASGQTTSAGGTGKTTADMQTASTFIDAGWDFVGESTNGTEDIWSVCEGADYPKLKWQFVIGDFDGDRYTDFADFCIFAKRWLQSDHSFWCPGGGADLTNDGDVDFGDLNEWLREWLTGP